MVAEGDGRVAQCDSAEYQPSLASNFGFKQKLNNILSNCNLLITNLFSFKK
jgi:hypothetical protein